MEGKATSTGTPRELASVQVTMMGRRRAVYTPVVISNSISICTTRVTLRHRNFNLHVERSGSGGKWRPIAMGARDVLIGGCAQSHWQGGDEVVSTVIRYDEVSTYIYYGDGCSEPCIVINLAGTRTCVSRICTADTRLL